MRDILPMRARAQRIRNDCGNDEAGRASPPRFVAFG